MDDRIPKLEAAEKSLKALLLKRKLSESGFAGLRDPLIKSLEEAEWHLDDLLGLVIRRRKVKPQKNIFRDSMR